MSEVKVLPPEKLGRNFIPAEYLPPGEDEFYLRNRQSPRSDGAWRHLRAREIEVLVKNGNTCDDWDWMLVTDPFTPAPDQELRVPRAGADRAAGEGDPRAPRLEAAGGHHRQPGDFLRPGRQRGDPQRPLPGPLHSSATT